MSLSVAAILSEPAWRTPEKIAVVEGAEVRTYAELWREVLDLAAALREGGIEPGDRVALLVPNVTDFPRTYYAIIAAGGVVVPIHLLLTPPEIAYILRDSGAKLMLAHAARAEDAATAAELAESRILPFFGSRSRHPRGACE
jgi:long-chain acyl-CoA synthetase